MEHSRFRTDLSMCHVMPYRKLTENEGRLSLITGIYNVQPDNLTCIGGGDEGCTRLAGRRDGKKKKNKKKNRNKGEQTNRRYGIPAK